MTYLEFGLQVGSMARRANSGHLWAEIRKTALARTGDSILGLVNRNVSGPCYSRKSLKTTATWFYDHRSAGPKIPRNPVRPVRYNCSGTFV